jgi:hypothetical protein
MRFYLELWPAADYIAFSNNFNVMRKLKTKFPTQWNLTKRALLGGFARFVWHKIFSAINHAF